MGINIGGKGLFWASGVDNTGLKKDSEEAVNIVSSMGEKIARKKVFNSLITQEKEVIKQIEKDLNDLTTKVGNASAGTARQTAQRDLNAARKALNEERANLANLQQQSIANDNAEIDSKGKLTSSIGSLVGKVFTAVAAWKLFKYVMESTDSTAVLFHSTINGLKTGLEYLAKSVASMDFSNFFSGLRDALTAGRKYTQEENKIQNIRRENKIKELDLEKEIEELRRVTYEDDKTSNEVKLKASNDLLKKMEEKSALVIDLAKREFVAVSELTSKKNKLSEKEIQYAIENFTIMEETGDMYFRLTQAIEGYNKRKKQGFVTQDDPTGKSQYVELGHGKDSWTQVITEEQINKYQKQLEDLGPNAKTIAEITKKYEKLTDKEKDIILTAIVKKKEAENAYMIESKRVFMRKENMEDTINNLRNEKSKANSEFEADLAQKRIDNALNIETQLLSIQKDSAAKQRAEAELAYQKTINDLDKQKAETLKKYNEINGGIDKAGQRTNKYINVIPEVDNQDMQLRQTAEEVKNGKIKEINEKAAKELIALNREITNNFLSDIDKQIVAINTKYDIYREKAIALSSGQEELDFIEKKRQEELAGLNKESVLKVTEFYKKAFGDISSYGYGTIKKLTSEMKGAISAATIKKAGDKTFYVVSIPDIDKEGKAVRRNVELTIEEFNAFEKRYIELSRMTKKLNPFAAVASSYKDLIKALKSGDKEAQGNALEQFDQAAESCLNTVSELSTEVGDVLSDSAKEGLKAMNDLASGFKDVAVGIGKIVAGDKLSGVIQLLKGLWKTISTIWKGEKKFNTEQQDYWNKTIEMAVQYRNVLIDILQAQKSATESVFINDYASKILQASKALKLAEQDFNKAFSNSGHRETPSTLTSDLIIPPKDRKSLDDYLTNLQIQIGVTKKKWLFITTGSKPVYGSLLEKYPALIDQNGKFNNSLAETILQMEGLPGATKVALQALVDYTKQAEESQAAIDSAIDSMAGFISDNLRAALITAWDDGTDAFLAFKDSVTSGLKDIVSQMIYNAVFGQAFKELQDNMQKSFGVGGDMSIIDDLQKFFSLAPDLVEKWKEGMTAAQKESLTAGFDWTKIGTGTTESSMSGVIQQQITEKTADVLVGQINAIQINLIESLKVFQQGLIYQKQTADNTQKTVELLQVITTRSSSVDSLRAAGL